MGPLRIVFVDSWKHASHDGTGTAVGISNLARALQLAGHEVRILRPRQGGSTLAGRAWFNLTLPGRLRSDPAPDLVVGFDLDGFRWSTSRDRRIPYVVALKGVAADEARFSRSALERGYLSLLGRMEGTNARFADRVLVPSRYSARIARRIYNLPARSVRIVPEPIDLRAWSEMRTALRCRPRRPTVLSVARQYPRKDTGTLLRALPSVRSRIPDVHLRVVGGGPELPRLRSLARQLGLEDAVTFHGALASHETVRRAYFEAHVFCLPSRQEGFGIVFAEAMAAGLPVVAARAGAVPEVVSHNDAGILVHPGDFQDLSRALIRLLENPMERRKLAAGGLQRVSRYGLEPVARTFLHEVGLARSAPGLALPPHDPESTKDPA